MPTEQETVPTQAAPVTFKTLRSVDQTTLGMKPLELTPPTPATVHFTNANGGLRRVDSKDVRGLAASTAQRLLKAGLSVE